VLGDRFRFFASNVEDRGNSLTFSR
jgi:hypothetical protein